MHALSLSRVLLFSLLITSIFAGASYAHAEVPRHTEVAPGVIDEKVKARDIIRESITIKNIGERPLNLFPSVEDVNPQNGDQNFAYAGNATDRSNSLANWIELSRGVIALAPGETKTVPFTIHVNMNAVPGTYHVQINFIDGSTRNETLSKIPDGSVAVNVEVLSDVKENLQLVKFSTDRVVFSGDDVLFNYQLENIGNQDLQPSGNIRVYDRRGKEVATVDVNRDGKLVSPDQKSQLASVWNAIDGFGQYKALITVNYGKSQVASVQDTIFFWIIPWKELLGLLVATLVALGILALYFRQWFEERHLHKLALAGLLTTHPHAVPAYIPPFPIPPTPPKKPQREAVPLAPVKEKEKKERVVLKIVENIVIGWRLFTTFKKKGRLTPQDIAKEKELARPNAGRHTSSEYMTSTTEQQRAPERGYQNAESQTVDLKRLRERPPETVSQNHVVNLKKPL
jgi:hypothetical protein